MTHFRQFIYVMRGKIQLYMKAYKDLSYSVRPMKADQINTDKLVQVHLPTHVERPQVNTWGRPLSTSPYLLVRVSP